MSVMNRRTALKMLGATAAAGTASPVLLQAAPSSAPSPTTLPASVAGVRMVDSEIARQAVDLARTVSAPHLFNHCLRTFVFGSLAGQAARAHYDEELLFVACVLHDLGLTDKFMGDLPFEIQGAEAAKTFLRERGMAAERIDVVWDGIAMHPLAISEYKRPEVALVGAGAGADVLGPDDTVTKAQIAQVLAAFPRLHFKSAFVTSCADAIRRHPRTASRTFMRDIAERNVPDFHPRNFCDAIDRAPFEE